METKDLRGLLGKVTEGEFVAGWGNGLTGPNTPSNTPTVGACVDMNDWDNKNEPLDHDIKDWKGYNEITSRYTPISNGDDTVAIAVGRNHKANARLIALAPSLARELIAARELLMDYISHFDNHNWSDMAVKEWLDAEWIPNVRSHLESK